MRIRRRNWRRLTAPQLFVSSFLALIGAGTVVLRSVPGLYQGEPLGWIDALFTATSAVCVTGLIVVDTATFFTPLGQGVLLVLIQLGGLGMIAFTTFIILLLGRRLSLRHESLTAGAAADVAADIDVSVLGRDVIRFTLLIEAAGAALLYALWGPRHGWSEALWPAVFHSVSAFCNAGFSTFSDSLVGAQTDALVLAVIMILVVSGGLGFLTLEELAMWRRAASVGRRFRLSLHSRLVIAATCILIVAGWIAFAMFEWENTLGELALHDKFVNSLFLSVTPRTAGFNTIDYASARDSTNFLTVLLMFVGGSPGSTAGGMKTTTFFLLGLLAISRVRGGLMVSIWNRSIPEETVQRAVGLAVVAFTAVTAGIFALTWTEAGAHGSGPPFLGLMFEVASAFNTVGLSMNITAGLSDAGRLLTVLLMFVGRVGPLTFAAALAIRLDRSGAPYRYAYQDVAIG